MNRYLVTIFTKRVKLRDGKWVFFPGRHVFESEANSEQAAIDQTLTTIDPKAEPVRHHCEARQIG